VIALSVFALADFSDALLILRAKELGLGFAAVILVYALYNAAYAGLSLPAGIVSDRLPRHAVYATGLLIFRGRIGRQRNPIGPRAGGAQPALQ